MATAAIRTVGKASPRRSSSLVEPRLFVGGVAALAGFVALTIAARGSGALPGDIAVERWVQSIPWGPLTTVFGWITAFNGTTQFTAGLILLVIVIAINPRTIVFAILASMSGTLYTLSNNFAERPRPPATLVQVTEHLGAHSYPSGHAVFAVTYVSLLVLCVGGKYLKRRELIIAGVAGVGVVLLISVARLATGGHWPTDVYGGWLLAGGWILLLLSFRPIGHPVLAWLGDPDGAWRAHHPNLPNTLAGRSSLWAHALYTPIIQLFERFGFATRGVLWAVMGVAITLSALQIGQRLDLYGSVRMMLSNTWRGPIAVVLVLALGGYALWGYVRVLFDPLRRGRSVSGLIARMGFLSSAVSYTILLVFTVAVGFASSNRGATQPIDPLSIVNLFARYGAVYVVGIITIGIGISQAIDAWREPFKHDVLTDDAPHGFLFHLWTWCGRIGLFARAGLFAFLGVLIVLEHASGSAWSTSFSHAFARIAQLPGGSIAAAILGIGLVALGLHSFGAARWMRLRAPVVVPGG